ncbi:MBL fold metallo-hydrolase [Halosegnis marinus]|uniref:MBL fold metallo-hydrolase n=1 Tax=Halosegnis marinus TaxID=3034023 RepID=UPI003613386C
MDLRPVADGDAVGAFAAHHTPGHNPGHTVFVHEGFDAAFLGDLVWEERGGYTTPFWLDSYDMRELRESVRRFAAATPDFERGLVAHGDPLLVDGSDRLRELADGLR